MLKISKFLIINVFVVAALLGIALIIPGNAKANCTPDASKQCAGNFLYWYDSCGALQNIAQNCNSTGQICQNAQCVDKTGATSADTSTTTTTTPSHYVTSCYNGNIYWFAKDGTVQDMYKSCDDGNSCTLDNCASRACVNELECDGSTCAQGSPDYITYCSGANASQNNSQTSTTQTATGQTTTMQTSATGQGLAIAIFASKNNDTDLQKNITAGGNDKINFLLIIRNTSSAAIDNVSVQTDLTSGITYAGNLKIDGMVFAGNVTSGINLGAVGPKISREMSFTATVDPASAQNTIQISSNVSAGNTLYDSDYVVLTINGKSTPTAAASNTNTAGGSGFGNFLANWWIWILVIIVLIVVFIIIFRRLSTNV